MSIYILQIETSTVICSCAISIDGITAAEHTSTIENSHTELLTILIDRCIKGLNITYSQLHAISISSGPGSYTSLRVGTATAKGMCYALGIPMIAIDSLTILANGINSTEKDDIIIPMIDARRMEVYMAIYDHNLNVLRKTAAHIIDDQSLDNLRVYAPIIHLCGSGASKFIQSYPSDGMILHHVTTSAKFMSSLSYNRYQKERFEDVAYFEPEYLKAPNISKSIKKYF